MLASWIVWSALVAPTLPAAPFQAPDSALLARLGNVVNATSDTLETLRGLAQAFRNDLPTASHTIILERATAIQNACTTGAGAVRRLQGILAARTVSPQSARSQAAFRASAEETVAALERCTRLWQALPRTDERADSLRAWGPYRVAQLDQTLRRYDIARHKFASAAGLPAPPIKR